MISRCLKVLSGFVLVAAAAVAIGCSQDPLSGGSQGLNMRYTPNPSGAGRFEIASLDINKLQALPEDPVLAALYGNQPLSFRFDPFTANLTLVAPVSYSNIALSEGTYNVTLIEFTPIQLVDENIAPPPYANCIDGIEFINRSSAPGIPTTIQFRTPQDDLSALTFTVHAGQTTLALDVNVPGLIDGYESSFTCEYLPCPGCPVDPVPELTAFDTPTFRAALLANVSIH